MPLTDQEQAALAADFSQRLDAYMAEWTGSLKQALAATPASPFRHAREDWRPFEGPRGGHGWENVHTGSKLYQEAPPSAEDEARDQRQREAARRALADLDAERRAFAQLPAGEQARQRAAEHARLIERHEEDMARRRQQGWKDISRAEAVALREAARQTKHDTRGLYTLWEQIDPDVQEADESGLADPVENLAARVAMPDPIGYSTLESRRQDLHGLVEAVRAWMGKLSTMPVDDLAAERRQAVGILRQMGARALRALHVYEATEPQRGPQRHARGDRDGLDSQGGALPVVDAAALRRADFVTLPEAVSGTNCGNCQFMAEGVCRHPRLNGQPVTQRNCCGLWSAPGTLRTWEDVPNEGPRRYAADQWITLGGHPEGDKKHVDGTHVAIDADSGEIRKGPAGLKGKTLRKPEAGGKGKPPTLKPPKPKPPPEGGKRVPPPRIRKQPLGPYADDVRRALERYERGPHLQRAMEQFHEETERTIKQMEAEFTHLRQPLDDVWKEIGALEKIRKDLGKEEFQSRSAPLHRRLNEIVNSLAPEADRLRNYKDGIAERARAALVEAMGDYPRADVSPEGARSTPSAKTGKAAQVAAGFLQSLLAAEGVAGGALTFQVHQIAADEKQRAYCKSDGNIYLGKNEQAPVAVHEMGHTLEFRLPGVRDAAYGFLWHRVGDEKAVKLKDVNPGAAYGDDETGRKDQFEKAFGRHAYYVGKHYRDATEIVSMGVEYLYRNPAQFARDDPEYFQFICGILDGSFRSRQ